MNLKTTTEKINIGNGHEANFIPGLNDEQHPLLLAKLIPREELSSLGEFLNRHGIYKALTTGVYDMIHIGHARYLELARNLAPAGDLGSLMVGLNSDSSVRSLKGPERPILEEMKRAEMLSFLESINYITIFDEPSGAEIIRQFQPDSYLCVEGSWDGDLAAKEEVKVMQEHGGQVYVTPRQDPILSTTAIIGRIETLHGEKLMGQFRDMVQGREDGKNE